MLLKDKGMLPAKGSESRQTVGRYELLFRIATGGMAEVHAARIVGHAGFQKVVAIKRMLPSLLDDEEFVNMFLDEARLAAAISSPHVVSTLDLGRAEDGSLYIAMELVLGITLAQLLGSSVRKREFVPLPIALDVLAQAAQGLHDAHVAKTPAGEPLMIVHRDVSPHNVLVGVDSRVRITDFGVARAIMRLTRTSTGQMKGKYGYFSPEQILGESIDQRSDVFALGIVAWETLLGRRLFAADNPLATLDRVRSLEIQAPRELRSEIPQSVSDVVMGALNRDRDKRLKTAGEFAEALRTAIRDLPTTAVGGALEDYVRDAGGEPLAQFQENIRRAMAHETLLDVPGIVKPAMQENEPTASDSVSGVVTAVAGSSPKVSRPSRASTPPRSSGRPSRPAESEASVPRRASMRRRTIILVGLAVAFGVMGWVGGKLGSDEPADIAVAPEASAAPVPVAAPAGAVPKAAAAAAAAAPAAPVRGEEEDARPVAPPAPSTAAGGTEGAAPVSERASETRRTHTSRNRRSSVATKVTESRTVEPPTPPPASTTQTKNKTRHPSGIMLWE